jgi:hypothetical protein
MAFAGTWNKISSNGGEAFFTAFEVPIEQLKRAADAKLTTVITDNGSSIVLQRTFTEKNG